MIFKSILLATHSLVARVATAKACFSRLGCRWGALIVVAFEIFERGIYAYVVAVKRGEILRSESLLRTAHESEENHPLVEVLVLVLRIEGCLDDIGLLDCPEGGEFGV